MNGRRCPSPRPLSKVKSRSVFLKSYCKLNRRNDFSPEFTQSQAAIAFKIHARNRIKQVDIQRHYKNRNDPWIHCPNWICCVRGSLRVRSSRVTTLPASGSSPGSGNPSMVRNTSAILCGWSASNNATCVRTTCLLGR